jgi:hypothetical protein
MSETDKLKSLHTAVPTYPPVPFGLLRRPRLMDSMPYEMQIIKTLVFRVFASSETTQGAAPVSYAPGCYIYPVSSPLVTKYEHYYGTERFQITYRMGFNETYLSVPTAIVSALVSGKHNSQLLHE